MSNFSSVSHSLQQSSHKYEIKKQFFINETGHFKYFKNNTILINFVDKVKLCMDDYSLQMFLKDNMRKSFCLLYLPDNSQHEICLAEKNEINTFFAKYLSFLEQWLVWLLDTDTIRKETVSSSDSASSAHVSEKLDFRSLQTHLSQLKLFNYSMGQDSSDFDKKLALSNHSHETVMSVSNLLKENGQFLKNISK